jgi:hypothetical protein
MFDAHGVEKSDPIPVNTQVETFKLGGYLSTPIRSLNEAYYADLIVPIKHESGSAISSFPAAYLRYVADTTSLARSQRAFCNVRGVRCCRGQRAAWQNWTMG